MTGNIHSVYLFKKNKTRKDMDTYSSTLKNLTPHAVTVFLNDETNDKTPETVVYPIESTQQALRVRSRPQVQIAKLDNGVRVFTPATLETNSQEGDPLDHSDPKGNRGCEAFDNFPYTADQACSHPDLIVSMIASERIPTWYRGKVYIPDTGPQAVVRDQNGKILGVKRLCLVHKGSGKA